MTWGNCVLSKLVGVCFLQKTGAGFYIRILVDLALQHKMILELKARCAILPRRNAQATSCQGMKLSCSDHRARPAIIPSPAPICSMNGYRGNEESSDTGGIVRITYLSSWMQ